MTNQKLTRIRTKPVTNMERARLRAAKRAKTRKAVKAETERRMADAIPAFLRIEADECERPPVPADQPRDYGPKSGILITRPIHGCVERVERDQTRTGFLLMLLSFAIVALIAVKIAA